MEVIKAKPKSKKAKKAGKAIEKAAKAQEVAKEAQAKVNKHLEVKEGNKENREKVAETANEHKAKTEKAIDLLTKAKAKNTEFKATAKEHNANVKNLKAELQAAKKAKKSPQEIAAIESNIKNAKEEFKTKEDAHKAEKTKLKEVLTSMNINIKKVSNKNLEKTQKTVEKTQKDVEAKTEKDLKEIKKSEKTVDKELQVANKALEVASKETSTRTAEAEKLTKKVETSKSSKVNQVLEAVNIAIKNGMDPVEINEFIKSLGLKPAKAAKVFERVEKMQEFKEHEGTVTEATKLKEASTNRHRELTEASEAFEAKGKEAKAAEKAEKKANKEGVAETEVKELDPVEAALNKKLLEANIPKPGAKADVIEIAKYNALVAEFKENARADVEAEMTKQNAETMESNVNAEASDVAEGAVRELPAEFAEPAGKEVGDAEQKNLERIEKVNATAVEKASGAIGEAPAGEPGGKPAEAPVAPVEAPAGEPGGKPAEAPVAPVEAPAEKINEYEKTLGKMDNATNLSRFTQIIRSALPSTEIPEVFEIAHSKVLENSSKEQAIESRIRMAEARNQSTQQLYKELDTLRETNKVDLAKLRQLTNEILSKNSDVIQNYTERNSNFKVSEGDIIKSATSLQESLKNAGVETPEVSEALKNVEESKSNMDKLDTQLKAARIKAMSYDDQGVKSLRDDLQRATNEYNANIINLQKVAKSVVSLHAAELPEGTITEFDTPNPLNEQSLNELRTRPLTRLADMAEELSYETLPTNVQLTLHTLTENAKKADTQLNNKQRYLESLKNSPLRNSEEIKKIEGELETAQAIHSTASNKLNEFINNTFTPEAVEKATIRNNKYIDKTPEELAVKRAAFKLTDAYKNGDVMPEDFDMMVEDAVQSSVNNAEFNKYKKNLTDEDIDNFKPEQKKEYLEFMGASRNKAREVIRQSHGIKLVGEDIDISKLPKPKSAVKLELLETATFNELQPSSELQGKYNATTAKINELTTLQNSLDQERQRINAMKESDNKSKQINTITKKIRENNKALTKAEKELNALTNSARREQYIEQGVNGLSSGLKIEDVPPKYRDEVIDRFNKAEEANISAVKTVSAKKLMSAEKANSVNGLINEFQKLNPSSELSANIAKLIPTAKQLEKANKNLQKQLDKANSEKPVDRDKVATLIMALQKNLGQLHNAKKGITDLISRANTNQESANMLSDLKNGKIAVSDIKDPDVKTQVVYRYSHELMSQVPSEIIEDIKELDKLKDKLSKKDKLTEADITRLNLEHNKIMAKLTRQNPITTNPVIKATLLDILKKSQTQSALDDFNPISDIRQELGKTLKFNKKFQNTKLEDPMKKRELDIAKRLAEYNNASLDIASRNASKELTRLSNDLSANKAKLDDLYGRTQNQEVINEIAKALAKRKSIIFEMEEVDRNAEQAKDNASSQLLPKTINRNSPPTMGGGNQKDKDKNKKKTIKTHRGKRIFTRKHRVFNQATMRRHLKGYRAF
jgi:hypothetical protein